MEIPDILNTNRPEYWENEIRDAAHDYYTTMKHAQRQLHERKAFCQAKIELTRGEITLEKFWDRVKELKDSL